MRDRSRSHTYSLTLIYLHMYTQTQTLRLISVFIFNILIVWKLYQSKEIGSCNTEYSNAGPSIIYELGTYITFSMKQTSFKKLFVSSSFTNNQSKYTYKKPKTVILTMIEKLTKSIAMKFLQKITILHVHFRVVYLQYSTHTHTVDFLCKL